MPAYPGGTLARLLPRSLAAAISLLKRLAMDSGTSLLLSEAAPSPGVLLRPSDPCELRAAYEHDRQRPCLHPKLSWYTDLVSLLVCSGRVERLSARWAQWSPAGHWQVCEHHRQRHTTVTVRGKACTLSPSRRRCALQRDRQLGSTSDSGLEAQSLSGGAAETCRAPDGS